MRLGAWIYTGFLKIRLRLIFIFADYENSDVAYFHFFGIISGLWQRKRRQANI